jgi:hypothetical protein
MKYFRRIKVFILSGAVAFGGLVWAAAPALASPSLSAYGGPAEIWVSGSGFTAGASVRIDVISNPGWRSVRSETTQADQYGDLGVEFYNLSYAGSVWVAADQLSPAPSLGTLWAQTTVSPPPQFLVNGTGQPYCGYPVSVEAYGFERYYNVRLELLPQNLSTVLDTRLTTADGIGDAYASPPLSTKGYTGWAWIVADEYGNGSSGFGPPAPATAWYHLYVC